MTPKTQQKSGLQDYLFIGSGISSAFTLWNFLNKIQKVKNFRPLQITVLDKYGEFNKGIPYGERSGKAVLLITNLKSFLPEPELTPFMEWLSANKSWLLEEFKADGGVRSAVWLEKNQDAIANNQWAGMFLPRYFFGCYMAEQVGKIVGIMEAANQIQITFKQAEVINISRLDDLWMADTGHSGCITAKKIIMGIGSLPTNYLWKEKHEIREKNLLFLNDLYANNFGQAVDQVHKQISKQSGRKINVLMVGANASALEVLYRLNDREDIAVHCNKFYFLSTYGILPDSELDTEKLKTFKPGNLKALMNKAKISSAEINEAATRDLDKAAKIELGAFSTVGVISEAIGKLLGRLDPLELENFACFHGNEIGRRQRCAGEHYVETVRMLESEKRFEHIAGRFHDLQLTEEGARVFYSETESGKIKSLNDTVSVVINCSGGMSLDNPKIPKVLRKLIQGDLLAPNASRIGFKVNDSLEAQPDFHIVGPLLAGNVIENKAVWHVEHCGRIIWLSKILAGILSDPILYKKELDETEFHLLRIGQSEEHRSIYTQALKELADGNPYGSFPYFAHHQSEDHDLIAFLFRSGSRTIGLMPMVLRPIASEELSGNYYDVISPYGYSGPIFEKDLHAIFIREFWHQADQWYKENKVVSEFIRFSLNQNHIGYSGELQPTLKNVKGKILPDQTRQWENFISKVRNNYRKASKYGLSFEVLKGERIDKNLVAEFHKVYIETMDRNNASSSYFFSLQYFYNLIFQNPEKFAIAMVMKDDSIISVELIIRHQDTIYAFLGGTRQEFFEMRPNDYLRVELIRWASSEGVSFYILGGGRKDDDGLYRHKKSLFPKDPDVIFYTGRKIILEEEYRILLKEHIRETPIHFETVQSTFFPTYRI
ncbi:GNAT family N-acetyltransferase [Robiginitalea sp. IMCC43444]|uniref:GNAT family N-acetyltransferase n=1 Tax=Robiginitalea sp. IMCC43444 TaxID=3459121 RepID=UPI00404238B6